MDDPTSPYIGRLYLWGLKRCLSHTGGQRERAQTNIIDLKDGLGLKPGDRLPLAAIPEPPRVSRHLNTAAGWLHEMGKLYREARRRQLDSSEASRLAWICAQAAKLATEVENLREIEKLREQLAALQAQAPGIAIPEGLLGAYEAAQEATGDDEERDPVSPVEVRP
jgi:hypothetical protein